MKKNIFFISFLLMFSFIFNAKATEYKIEGFKTVGVNQNVELSISYSNNGINSYNININNNWLIDKPDVASITNKGLVTGKSVGSATVNTTVLGSIYLTLGDFNGDGKVNTTDATQLRRYLSGEIIFSEVQVLLADINEDGVVNNADKEVLADIIGGRTGNNEIEVSQYTDGIEAYNKIPLKLGDVYRDGKVNTTDVTQIKRYVNGNRTFNEVQLLLADVNQDGAVTEDDWNLLENVLNLHDQLPSETIDVSVYLDGIELFCYIYVSYGDVNGDGRLNTTDVTQIKRYLNDTSLFTDAQKLIADVNQDGIVTDDDAELIKSVIANTAQLESTKIKISPYINGTELYYGIYESKNVNLKTISDTIEVVDKVGSTNKETVIQTFKSQYFGSSSNIGTISYDNSAINISYNTSGNTINHQWSVTDNIIEDSSTGLSDNIARENDVDLFVSFVETALKSAGYSEDQISKDQILQSNYETNGFELKFENGKVDYNDNYNFIVNLDHLYLNPTTSKTIVKTSETVTKTKEDKVENPNTGITIPAIGLGVLLALGATMYYLSKKKSMI